MSMLISAEVAADIFETAAEKVFVRGLYKGGYGYHNGDGGARCAAGYIRETTSELANVEDDDWWWIDIAATFALSLNLRIHPRANGEPNYVYSIARWNDTKGRTAADVRDAFLLVAKDLRNNDIR